MTDDDQPKTEILIIRRSSGDDHEGHHGGAWKIAYADFVTAMMAFFLVMWLINSANEATRARVASYFNPIKMTDAAPSGRGLSESSETKKSDTKKSKDGTGGKTGGSSDSNAAGKVNAAQSSESKQDEALLQDPYKAIDGISRDGQAHPSGRTVEIVSQKIGDPFDPKAWEALREGKPNAEVANAESAAAGAVPGKPIAVLDVVNQKKPEAIQNDLKPPNATILQTSERHANEKKKVDTADTEQLTIPNADQIRANVLKSVADVGASAEISVEVKMTPEGLLIVLSDKVGRAMFEVGSAAPTPALVSIAESVGKILEGQTGRVVVRGHTDARQYKKIKFDNWQLSTARAHLASYMLLRGGLEESRLWKIEGHGSSDLENENDPFADENRRVEFLLSR